MQSFCKGVSITNRFLIHKLIFKKEIQLSTLITLVDTDIMDFTLKKKKKKTTIA